jgi:predicted alpha/beta-fold hydrolase
MHQTVEPCQPPHWAQGGHRQTLLGHWIQSRVPEIRGLSPWAWDRVRIDTESELAVQYRLGSTSKLVFLFHGLSGSSESDYMRQTADELTQAGHSVVCVNHRNCGQGRGLATGPYHSGRADDLGSVLEWGRLKFPSLQQVAVGFSLSGNALLCLLSGRRGQGKPHPDYAICVNAPIELGRTARLLQQGLSRLYDLRFVWRLRGLIHEQGFGPIPRWATLQDIDRLYTAPAGGFESDEGYYLECSTSQFLDSVRVPTLLLSAADDPIVDVQSYRNAKLSSAITLRIENTGGHMGYLSASTSGPLGLRPWLPAAIARWVNNIVEPNEEQTLPSPQA